MRIKVIFILLCLAALAVSGCNGARETDELAYIITIGIDVAPNNELTITYRVAIPRSLAAAEAGGGKKATSELITLTAPSLVAGRNMLNSVVSREVVVSQIKSVIIGEDLARRGLMDIISPLVRYREYRGSMFLLIVHGAAKEAMEKDNPMLDVLPSRYVEEIELSHEESSFYLSTNIHDFYKRLKNRSGAPYAAAVGVNPLSGKDRAERPPVKGSKDNEYVASQLPRQSGNPVSFVGTAVFRDDKLAGFLTDKETRALAILTGEFPYGFIAFEDPLLPEKAFNVNLRLGNKPKIKVDITKDVPAISIQVLLEGEITSIASGIEYEAPSRHTLLEDQISAVIQRQLAEMLATTQNWGTDVVDFGYYIRPQFRTLDELDAYNWKARYPEAIFSINVTTQIRRTGLMRKTSPIKKE